MKSKYKYKVKMDTNIRYKCKLKVNTNMNISVSPGVTEKFQSRAKIFNSILSVHKYSFLDSHSLIDFGKPHSNSCRHYLAIAQIAFHVTLIPTFWDSAI